MLGTDGKADRIGFDALIQQLLGGKLGVGGGGRVDDKGFYIRHVGQKRENFQAVNKFVKQFEDTRKMMRAASNMKNPMKMMNQLKQARSQRRF